MKVKALDISDGLVDASDGERETQSAVGTFLCGEAVTVHAANSDLTFGDREGGGSPACNVLLCCRKGADMPAKETTKGA